MSAQIPGAWRLFHRCHDNGAQYAQLARHNDANSMHAAQSGGSGSNSAAAHQPDILKSTPDHQRMK